MDGRRVRSGSRADRPPIPDRRRDIDLSLLHKIGMATFREPQVVYLPPDAVARATAFADAVIETVNYRDSNQSVKEKIRDDHFVSKLGEEAVRLVFEKRDRRWHRSRLRDLFRQREIVGCGFESQ